MRSVIGMLEGYPLHTATEPGGLVCEEARHVPRVELRGRKISIEVPHDNGPSHWIMYVWAKDERDAVIGAAKLTHEDAPRLAFDLPAGTKRVTAYQCCSEHGLWKADPVEVA